MGDSRQKHSASTDYGLLTGGGQNQRNDWSEDNLDELVESAEDYAVENSVSGGGILSIIFETLS